MSEEVETRLGHSYAADDQYEDNRATMVSAAKDIVFSVLYEFVGHKHNFNAGQRFAHALKSLQAEADAKFRSDEPWYFDSDKKDYVTRKVTDLVKFIVDELAVSIDPEEVERRRKALEESPAARGPGALSALGAHFYGRTDAEDGGK